MKSPIYNQCWLTYLQAVLFSLEVQCWSPDIFSVTQFLVVVARSCPLCGYAVKVKTRRRYTGHCQKEQGLRRLFETPKLF